MIETTGKMSRRLSLGIMLMATPVFVLALGVLYVQSHNLIHDQVTKRVTNTLNATQHYVRNYMKTIETAANVNMWMMERNFNPDSLQSVSNRIVTLNPNVCSSSVFVVPGMMKGQELFSLYTVRQDGNVITYKETTYDYRDKALYALPVSTGHACWIDPYKDNIEWGVDPNKAVATYCLPIKQHDGRIIGVVATEFLFNHLAKILKEAENPYPNAYYIMLSSDGRYLIHPDSTQLFRKTIFTDADPGSDNDIISLGHQMIERKQGSMHIETPGQTYHVCYQPVADTDWSLALVCPIYEAMESYYKLGSLIIALLVIGLLGILLLSNRVVKKAVMPINQMIDAARNIAHGQYNNKISSLRNKGSISRLQHSFIGMQEAISKHMGKLQHNVDELKRQNKQLSWNSEQADVTTEKKYQFIQHLTRQMRMPLNVITGFADMMGSSSQAAISNDEMDSITTMMKSNVVSMNRLLILLFDATDKKQGTREDEVSCNEIARVCINHTLNHEPNAQIKLETEVGDDTRILTCKIYLICVLCELLYNAATNSDGKNVLLHVDQTDTTIRFTIQDAGPGLPADMPDLVYEPYTKQVDMPKGSGMGLPLAKRYTISLGGTLIVDTSYTKGCRIVIELPK